MGNYNSYYENYYRNLNRRKINTGNTRPCINNINKNSIYKRLIIELTGTFLLFAFVLGCKLIVTPETKLAYSFFHEALTKEYNYKGLISKVSKIKYKDFQDEVIDEIEKIRCTIINKSTFKERLKKDFTLPIGTIIVNEVDDEKKSVNILAKKSYSNIYTLRQNNNYIKSLEGGYVKQCGVDDNLGKYILIDHGYGIETKYYGIEEFLVDEGDAVGKYQSIAKINKHGINGNEEYGVSLFYMGENKDIHEYLNSPSCTSP